MSAPHPSPPHRPAGSPASTGGQFDRVHAPSADVHNVLGDEPQDAHQCTQCGAELEVSPDGRLFHLTPDGHADYAADADHDASADDAVWDQQMVYTPEEAVGPQWQHLDFIAPDQSFAWDAAGFTPQVANDWASRGFGVDEALRWSANSFSSPASAQRWRDAGFTPTSAAAWLIDGLPDPEVPLEDREEGVS